MAYTYKFTNFAAFATVSANDITTDDASSFYAIIYDESSFTECRISLNELVDFLTIKTNPDLSIVNSNVGYLSNVCDTIYTINKELSGGLDDHDSRLDNLESIVGNGDFSSITCNVYNEDGEQTSAKANIKVIKYNNGTLGIRLESVY